MAGKGAKKKRKQRLDRRKAAVERRHAKPAAGPDVRADPALKQARELHAHGRIEAAVALLRETARKTPKDWRVHDALGRALLEDGHAEGAERAHRESIRLHPDHPPALMHLGDALSAAGQTTEAADMHRRALQLQPTLGAAWLRLVRTRRFDDPADEELGELERLVKRRELPAVDREAMHFALGKIYDDLSDADRAFEHIHLANRMHSERKPFPIAAILGLMDRMMAFFDAARVRKTEGWGSDSEVPVFVLGMPRCGSTLIEQIISSHPRAYGVGELRTLVRLTADLPQQLKSPRPFPDCLTGLRKEQVPPLARRYLSRLCRDAPRDVLRVCDKMLSHTLLIGFIAMLFPRARVIHCERDPMDIALSMYMHSFSGSGAGFTYDLDHIGSYQRKSRQLMAHWRSLAPMSIVDVQYEQLVRNPEAGTRSLLEAVELPWDAACLAFHEAKRQVRTVSEWQVRQPIHQRSVARWRRYEKHLQPLKRYLD